MAPPATEPAPESVWAEASTKPPVTVDTSSTAAAATSIVPLDAIGLLAAARASVPAEMSVAPV